MSAPIVARHHAACAHGRGMDICAIYTLPTGHAPKLHALTIIAYFAYKLLAAPVEKLAQNSPVSCQSWQ